jgi:transketolase
MDGLTVHGGICPYSATCLTFFDDARNTVYMSTLIKLSMIHIMTHHSIVLRQDGPTHQLIEHIASLRMTPNLDLWRHRDAAEAVVLLDEWFWMVSMPSTHVFGQQPQDWRDAVLPRDVANLVSFEAGATQGWYRYSDRDGIAIGLGTFGESTTPEVRYNHFGLIKDAVVAAAASLA